MLENKKCAHCGSAIIDGLFCPKCGKKNLAKGNCSKCGVELVPDTKFCSKCGKKVPAESKSDRKRSLQNNKLIKWISSNVLFVVCVSIVCFAVIAFSIIYWAPHKCTSDITCYGENMGGCAEWRRVGFDKIKFVYEESSGTAGTFSSFIIVDKDVVEWGD